MNAIISIVPLSNRHQKRKFKQQAMKFAPALQTIIDKFIFALWTYPDHIGYEEIYKFYHDLWYETIDSFRYSEADIIGINGSFFKDNYQSKI